MWILTQVKNDEGTLRMRETLLIKLLIQAKKKTNTDLFVRKEKERTL